MNLLLVTMLLAMLSSGSAQHVRRKGEKPKDSVVRGLGAISAVGKNRQLKGHKGYDKGYYQYYQEDDDDYSMYEEDHHLPANKRGNGGGGRTRNRMNRNRQKDLECKTVVEPAEFIMENAFSEVLPMPEDGSGNATDTSGDDADEEEMETGGLGTQYIFQGPLFDHDLDPLQDYFVSGVCTRTWSAGDNLPGAAQCKFTFTLETGASIIVAGEVFDDWQNVLAINGGTFELSGISGQIVLVAVDDDLDEQDGDFFEADYIRGQVTMIYEICPEGYWDPLVVDDPEDLEGATFPDPFGLEE